MNRIAAIAALDWVQLSGNESLGILPGDQEPVIKAIHISPEQHAEEILAEILKEGTSAFKKLRLSLLDTQSQECLRRDRTRPSTGNWQGSIGRFPVIIAGGLTPENVGQLIREVTPWGVDVSRSRNRTDKKTSKNQGFYSDGRLA